ncbi:MAG TPA: hypothetical protein VMH91_00090, partial [Candidatus Paceibacterota bacterium]|nr:hypothetical protein [Candidatus Paceibacterota bacterium]
MNKSFRRGIDYLRGAYLYLRWVGKPHFDYYKALMSDDVRRGFGELNPVWAPFQLERLIAHGIKPQHTLLDIGCGYLRGGQYIIDYLEEGNYTGTDI